MPTLPLLTIVSPSHLWNPEILKGRQAVGPYNGPRCTDTSTSMLYSKV